MSLHLFAEYDLNELDVSMGLGLTACCLAAGHGDDDRVDDARSWTVKFEVAEAVGRLDDRADGATFQHGIPENRPLLSSRNLRVWLMD
jgi:hypothetical protein